MKHSSSQDTGALFSWPLAVERYDRSPELRQEERDELACLFEQSHDQFPLSQTSCGSTRGCIALDTRSQTRFLCDHTPYVPRDVPTSNDLLGLVC